MSATAEELEAETISYLICKKFGLHTSAEKYIAAFIKSEDDLLKFGYESVIKIADKIEDIFFNKKLISKATSQKSLF